MGDGKEGADLTNNVIIVENLQQYKKWMENMVLRKKKIGKWKKKSNEFSWLRLQLSKMSNQRAKDLQCLASQLEEMWSAC